MSCPHGNPIGGCDTCDEVDAAFEAGKRSALAEQPAQQEPGRNHWEDGDVFERIGAMKKQPAQQQEPVKACVTGQCPCKSECDSAQCCLYTSPPAQRKPLTDEQLRKVHHEDQFGLFYDYDEFEHIARAIEAAHGIKENT